MCSYVTSADGTPIAFDRLGEGPPVILTDGIFCDRQATRALAEQLLPDGAYTVLAGQDHDAPVKVVAPVVAAFLSPP